MGKVGEVERSVVEEPGKVAVGLLAKLPQLDAEHVKEISGTLPGRLLGRAAALLVSVVTVLLLLRQAENLLPSWVPSLKDDYPQSFNVVVGLAFLILIIQLMREIFEHFQARRMRQRVIQSEVKDLGYFRLLPYTARDRDRFARADHAHERALAWIEDAQTPILYLTGDSGTGKSSLLAAYVVPALRERGWLIVAARSYADPAAALETSLAASDLVWKKPPKAAGLHALLESAARRLARDQRQLLIILDQFEEFLILHEPAARECFLQLLRKLEAEPVPGLRLVLVLRSGYEAQILDVDLPMPCLMKNWFQLGAFTDGAARAFLKGSGLELSSTTFDQLLKGAAALETKRGLFRPIVLNLLGLIVARHAVRLPAGLNPEQVIQSYLKESVSAAEIRDDAPRVLLPMISEAHTKRPVEETALVAQTKLPLGRVRHCLQQLAGAGLVRPLGQQQLIWEIAHDFIATQSPFENGYG